MTLHSVPVCAQQGDHTPPGKAHDPDTPWMHFRLGGQEVLRRKGIIKGIQGRPGPGGGPPGCAPGGPHVDLKGHKAGMVELRPVKFTPTIDTIGSVTDQHRRYRNRPLRYAQLSRQGQA